MKNMQGKGGIAKARDIFPGRPGKTGQLWREDCLTLSARHTNDS